MPKINTSQPSMSKQNLLAQYLINQEPSSNEESCLHFLPEHSYFKASTSVGSGKTVAAISYMLSNDQSITNFLYVAPTIKLVTQTSNGLKEALEESNRTTRNIHLIHSEKTSGHQSTSQVAINAVNNATANTGTTIILTTATFLNILPQIERKQNWSVIMDESFSPISFVTYELGSRDQDKEKSKEYFSNLFKIDNHDNDSVLIAKGQSTLVKAIANNDLKEAGSMYSGMQPLARAVVNGALNVELTGKRTDRYTFATWVSPDHFNAFYECVFLSALFEQTILYHLWSAEYKATFRTHKFFDSAINTDIHTTQGPLVSVGHVLHPDDHASKYNLQRNYKTGQREAKQGRRVIDKCVEIIQTYFTGKAALLQINKWTGYGNSTQVNNDITVIPCMPQGLNDYQDHTAIAALAVTNPEPHILTWLKNRTKLPDHVLYQAFRIHNVYQACGRTAIRDWNNQKQVVFLVASQEDAKFLHDLFSGSKWLGQVGDIPSLKPLSKANTSMGNKKLTLQSNLEYRVLRKEYNALTAKKSRAKKVGTELSSSDYLRLNAIKREIATLKQT